MGEQEKALIVSFVGAGQMGEALLGGGLDSGSMKSDCVYLSDVRKDRLRELKDKYQTRIAKDNISAAKIADLIILAVKPQNIDGVLDEIADYVDGKKIIVSIVAGISINRILQKLYKDPQVFRVMPNNPALLRAGISVISASGDVSDANLDFVSNIFSEIGEVLIIDESYQNLATALCGSGPAYFYLVVKLLIEAGVELGLENEIAEKLVNQTIFGAAKMVKEAGKSPEELIKMVASPGGTTEAALEIFEKYNFKKGITAAVGSAVNRAIELGGGEFGQC